MPGVVTCYGYDLLTLTLLAELPYSNVSFSQRLNAAGSFSGDVQLSDPGVKLLGPIPATNPSKTLTIVDLDGQIVWGGINWTRTFDSETQSLKVGGLEAWSYFARRLQAVDYTNPPLGPFWSANPADARAIVAQVVHDALLEAGSAFAGMVINLDETAPNPNPVTGSFSKSQSQAIDSMTTTLAGGGYGTGFDFAIDWDWAEGQGSFPIPTLNLSYPRRGRAFSATSPVLLTGGSAGIKYTWPEDGSKQANSIRGTASGAANLSYDTGPDASVLGGRYPLLEKAASLSTVVTQSQLETAILGDQAKREWPTTSPQFTMPIVGDPGLGTFVIGDDERIVITPDERFPAGADTVMRLAAVDVKVENDGVSTMTHTMNPPVALAPTPAPPN